MVVVVGAGWDWALAEVVWVREGQFVLRESKVGSSGDGALHEPRGVGLGG